MKGVKMKGRWETKCFKMILGDKVLGEKAPRLLEGGACRSNCFWELTQLCNPTATKVKTTFNNTQGMVKNFGNDKMMGTR